MISDSRNEAEDYINRPRRNKQAQNKETSVIESWQVSSDSESDLENEGTYQQHNLETNDVMTLLKIKQEKVETLEKVVENLNKRIGTEIVDDVDHGTSAAIPRYRNRLDVNTLHYQIDAEFANDTYFKTDVTDTEISFHCQIFDFFFSFLVIRQSFVLR